MTKLLQLPEPGLKGRAHSWHDINCADLDTRILQENRWVSFVNLQSEEIPNSCFTLEIFYKITDIVLVICAVVFTFSSIASIILWICGLH